MEDKRKDLIEDNEIDHLLQQLYGFSDEQLLRDFKKMEADNTPRPELEPFPDEFDRIWEDIQAERAAKLAAEEKGAQPEEAATAVPAPRRRKLRWKRLVVVGLAACFLTLGFCFVAVGKKSYFYRERYSDNTKIILNNDTNIKVLNNETDAYAMVKEEFGIKPMRFGYLPEGMRFVKVSINETNAVFEYAYNGKSVYFVQMKEETEVSNCYSSDGKENGTIKNKWVGESFKIKEEKISDSETKYEAHAIIDGVYYSLAGIMSEEEFTKTVERLMF